MIDEETLQNVAAKQAEIEFIGASARLHNALECPGLAAEIPEVFSSKHKQLITYLAAISLIFEIPNYQIGEDDLRGFSQVKDLLGEWLHDYKSSFPTDALLPLLQWNRTLGELITKLHPEG